MPFWMVREDITRMDVDAVVNAANTALKMGGGVCGAIFSAAGPREMQAACDALAPIAPGEAVATPGFGLKAKYVIHTAGLPWQGGHRGEEEAVRACYRSSLRLAKDMGLGSVAFPLLSSGLYGYPPRDAVRVAREEIRSFLMGHDMEVWLALFGADAVKAGFEQGGDIQQYIDDNYVDEALRRDLQRRRWFQPPRRGGEEGAAEPHERPERAESTALHGPDAFPPPTGRPGGVKYSLPDVAPSGEEADEQHSLPTRDASEIFYSLREITEIDLDSLEAQAEAPAEERAKWTLPHESPRPQKKAGKPKKAWDSFLFPQRIQKGETPPTSVEERIRAPRPAGAKPSLGASLALDQPFSRLLLGLIDQKGLSDPEVYHRANIDRRLFSKLRQDGYMPSKRTALALCVALEMTAEEAQRLLVAAGFALSRSILADVIVRYHLDRGIFDVFRINDVLYAYDQPLLGGSA